MLLAKSRCPSESDTNTVLPSPWPCYREESPSPLANGTKSCPGLWCVWPARRAPPAFDVGNRIPQLWSRFENECSGLLCRGASVGPLAEKGGETTSGVISDKVWRLPPTRVLELAFSAVGFPKFRLETYGTLKRNGTKCAYSNAPSFTRNGGSRSVRSDCPRDRTNIGHIWFFLFGANCIIVLFFFFFYGKPSAENTNVHLFR